MEWKMQWRVSTTDPKLQEHFRELWQLDQAEKSTNWKKDRSFKIFQSEKKRIKTSEEIYEIYKTSIREQIWAL